MERAKALLRLRFMIVYKIERRASIFYGTMDTTHSIHSGLKYDGLSSEAERDVRMHYTEIIAYLTGLSKHPGLDVIFDFQMSAYPTNQRPPAWATDEISKISVVYEEQDTVHQPQAPGAEVLANIERARKEDIEAVEARWKREMEGLRDQLRAAEAGCEKKCHDANRRGYAMGYAFADEKATKAFEAMRADLQRLTAENKKLEHRVAEESHWCKDANLATRTAEMHAQMLRTDVAQLQMENEGLKKQLVTKEDMVTPRLKLLQKMVDDLSSPPLVPDLQRLTAENKELREQIEEDKQMVQRHLKEIAKEHAVMTAWEKKEIERLTAENKMLLQEDKQIEQMVQRHLKEIAKEHAELKKENESQRKLVFPSLNLEAASSGVKLEPELAPKFPQASPQLVAALKAEKTWNDGIDVCYALTKKDYEDMMKAKGPLPSVEVVEDDVDLELLQKMVGDAPLPPSPPSPLVEEEGEMPDQLASCEVPGCYDCPVAEPKPKPKYNHHFWPSPTTKRFAKHIAKYAGKDPKAIKTHEDALNFIAKRAKISVETLLGYSIKQYQSSFEPWSLAGDPWSLPNSHYFQI